MPVFLLKKLLSFFKDADIFRMNNYCQKQHLLNLLNLEMCNASFPEDLPISLSRIET